VDTVRATRQARFVSTVAAAGEISDFSAVPQLWAVAAGLTVSVAVASPQVTGRHNDPPR
jgi:hypothetical protein